MDDGTLKKKRKKRKNQEWGRVRAEGQICLSSKKENSILWGNIADNGWKGTGK